MHSLLACPCAPLTDPFCTPCPPSPALPPCRRLLREEVTSGRLAAAESKAEVLGDLVDRVRFDAGGDAAWEGRVGGRRAVLVGLNGWEQW